MGNDYDFFQIDHTGVDSSTQGNPVQTRDLDMKISMFGAMNTGLRDSNDYTKTSRGFKFKDNLSDWSSITPPPFVMDGEYDENPYVLDSTTKRIRNDQFIRMGMTNNGTANAVDYPGHDVSDRKMAAPSTTVYLPREGWRSFGGKYDFSIAYQGSRLRGNLESS